MLNHCTMWPPLYIVIGGGGGGEAISNNDFVPEIVCVCVWGGR